MQIQHPDYPDYIQIKHEEACLIQSLNLLSYQSSKCLCKAVINVGLIAVCAFAWAMTFAMTAPTEVYSLRWHKALHSRL